MGKETAQTQTVPQVIRLPTDPQVTQEARVDLAAEEPLAAASQPPEPRAGGHPIHLTWFPAARAVAKSRCTTVKRLRKRSSI